MTATIEMPAKLLEARGRTYQLLGALFCEPEQDILGDKTIFQLLRDNMEALYPGLKVVEPLLETFSKQPLQALLIEYTRIFLGPFQILAHPYSSMYYDEPGLMTPVTQWVDQYYRACGYGFDPTIRDLPDHIAVELEFMAQLAFKEGEVLLAGDEEEAFRYQNYRQEFLQKHLGVWGISLCDAIRKSESSAYYSALADCLQHFIEQEKNLLITYNQQAEEK